LQLQIHLAPSQEKLIGGITLRLDNTTVIEWPSATC